VRQGHARYLFRPLPALLRHLPVPSFMFRSGLADLQSEEGTYESTRHAQRKRSEYRRCCTKRVSHKAQFKRRPDLPGLLRTLRLRQTRCHRNNSAVAFACY
jgi:hypothetical protein